MVNTFIITGNTWSCREALKRLEGRWVPHLNAWLLPETERDSVSRLRTRTSLDKRLGRVERSCREKRDEGL